MGARSRMTMRATIQRNVAAKDDYGNIGPPSWSLIGEEVPCYVWAGKRSARQEIVEDKKIVYLDMPGAMLPLSTDIQNGDRLFKVTNRLKKQLFAIMYVDKILLRKDHYEIMLRDYA